MLKNLVQNKKKAVSVATALLFIVGSSAYAKMAMPDTQMQSVLTELKSLGGKPIEKLTPAEARKQPTPADAVMKLLKKQGKSTAPEAVAKVENRTILGPAGQIPIRIYTPAGTGPFPVLVYYHGGGWVIANIDTYDSSARALANAANCIVVSSHYRQGPEHKFPAAHEDAFAAAQWVMNNATSFNGNPNKIAIGGESAGGNMATAVTMMLRDKKGKMPVHQMLIYPVTNDNMNTQSYIDNANAKPLNKPMVAWFANNYFKKADHANPYAFPLKAKNLKGLPPATIILAQIDPLMTEGKQYADKLKAAGIPVNYKLYNGVAHEFFGMGAVVDKAKDAVKVAATDLKKAFNK